MNDPNSESQEQQDLPQHSSQEPASVGADAQAGGEESREVPHAPPTPPAAPPIARPVQVTGGGEVLNVRGKDNLVQGIIVVLAMILGAIVGVMLLGDHAIFGGYSSGAIGAVGGLIVGVIVSQVALCALRRQRKQAGGS
jgi:hypothetical protein